MVDEVRTDITVYVGSPTPDVVRVAREMHPDADIPETPWLCSASPLDQLTAFPEVPSGSVLVVNSPYVVDLVAGDCVRVVGQTSDGEAIARPLSHHPEWKHWHSSLRSGEFWMSFCPKGEWERERSEPF